MARRRSSGFFETVFKTVFQTGTTVHRDRDWLGRSRTTVKHHDTGKTKTYTHGTGLVGTTTKTKTKDRQGKVTERGKLKKTFLLGTPVENATKTDRSGRKVKRIYGRGFFGKKMITTTSDGSGETKPGFFGGTKTSYVGECHGCDGNGKRTAKCGVCSGSGTFVGTCGRCDGTGQYQPAARECWRCHGCGTHRGSRCKDCSGTGQFVPPKVLCRKCGGMGKFSAGCKVCAGSGEKSVACKRCGGSGVYRKG